MKFYSPFFVYQVGTPTLMAVSPNTHIPIGIPRNINIISALPAPVNFPTSAFATALIGTLRNSLFSILITGSDVRYK